jgi:hypothetical protein
MKTEKILKKLLKNSINKLDQEILIQEMVKKSPSSAYRINDGYILPQIEMGDDMKRQIEKRQ